MEKWFQENCFQEIHIVQCKNDTTTVNTKPASDNKTNESNEIKNETSKPTNTTNKQKESNVVGNKTN